jgi:hypothetical protein
MLSIFVETSCNRYERDECITCHVFEPLKEYERSEMHLSPEQAQIMADKIKQVDVLSALAGQEINLTGGEASQNPKIVEIFKIFQTVSPHVCLHTNLDMNSEKSKRWLRLKEIMELSGRLDITLYPTVWEKSQKHFLEEILRLQKTMLVNVVFENLPELKNQINILADFFSNRGEEFKGVETLLEEYREKVNFIADNHPNCDEAIYTKHMGNIDAFGGSENFTLGINLLPGFQVDHNGKRSMNSTPFPKNPYLLECTAARGSIEIMTVQQNGNMTPCCDVGNLKCLPQFGNIFEDSAEQLQEKFEASRRLLESGVEKNRYNINNNNSGKWVSEGIPPYCI